jgi:hypothetical protein
VECVVVVGRVLEGGVLEGSIEKRKRKTKQTTAIGVCGVAVAVKAGKAGPRVGSGRPYLLHDM